MNCGRGICRFIVLVSALLAALACAAQEGSGHRVSRETASVDLTESVGLLQDASGQLTPGEVNALAQQGGMPRIAKPGFSMLRTQAKQILWLRFDLTADASAPRQWLLDAGLPNLDRIQLFTQGPDGSWVASGEMGTTRPFTSRPVTHRDFVFPVELTPGERTALMLRIEDTGAAPIRLTLWQPGAMRQWDGVVERLFCVYFGLAAGMLLYNLLLYVVLRDPRFLTYVAFIGSVGMAVAFNTGIGAQFVWGEWGLDGARGSSFWYAMATLFCLTLTRQFMTTRRRWPAADKVFAGISWVAAGAIVVAAFAPKFMASWLIVPTVLATSIAIDVLCIVAAFRRWPGAKYFCAAWLTLHFGALIAVANFFRLIPWSVNTPEAIAIGNALEMILLALALADRINDERREKERARSQTLAILQASQSFGKETRLDRLSARVTQIMASVAGATAVHFVFRVERNGWFVFAGEDDSERVPVENAAASRRIPLSAFLHVESTGEPLLLDDALQEERFESDTAFDGAECCSLMGLPVVHHGSLCAVLLLENRSARAAFTQSNLIFAQAVAGPLALSLQNALLYERLERRVEAQGAELREAQEQLLATARKAGMAEIATNVLHNVGNTLNSVNVSSHLMRKGVAGSRSAKLSLAVDLLKAHAGELGDFMEKDPKGRMLPGYLEKLAMALAAERNELMQHLDRLDTSVDHIKNVVATQQAYAGASMITERVHPSEIVEDVLRIAEDSLRANAVEVVKHLPDAPRVNIDKTRVVQILVNLVTNAMQAMEHVTDRVRRLTLQVDTGQHRLLFRVADCGMGIDPRHAGKLFSHGFTTREGGHGFGLHSCALAARELGGSITAHSDGPGKGAIFTLELPV